MLSPQIAGKLLEHIRERDIPITDTNKIAANAVRAALTPRELEIFALLASGESNQQIADQLSLSTWIYALGVGRIPSLATTAKQRQLALGHLHVSSAPDPTPARRLRARLVEARASGADFGAAWNAAVAVALTDVAHGERRGWRDAFTWTRPAWERGYLGEQISRVPLSLSLLDPPAEELR